MNDPQKWEYRLVTAPWKTPGEQWANLHLNPAGDEGWEAVAVLPAADDLHILMKRRKVENAKPYKAGGF